MPSPNPFRNQDTELLHLECRDWGHAWNLVFLARESPGVLIRRLECLRCQTGRFDYLTRTSGDVDGRVYRYADGYQYKGEGKPDKSDLRKQLTNRLFKQPRFKISSIPDDMPHRRHHG